MILSTLKVTGTLPPSISATALIVLVSVIPSQVEPEVLNDCEKLVKTGPHGPLAPSTTSSKDGKPGMSSSLIPQTTGQSIKTVGGVRLISKLMSPQHNIGPVPLGPPNS